MEDVDRRGKRVTGERLRGVDDATTVRVSKGEVLVTDGPFTESKEWIAGFDILECDNLDEAIEIAVPAPAGQRRQARAAAVLGRGLSDGEGSTDAADAVASVVADEQARLVAGLIRVTGDWDLAEDCVQDAVETALSRWPADGVPRNPAAWLTTVARNRALDVLRRRATERAKLQEAALMAERARRRRGPVLRRPAAAAVHLLPPRDRRSTTGSP